MQSLTPWVLSYFNARVQKELEAWPVSIYADFVRLAGLIEMYGPDLRMPHSRAMGDGLFELRCKGEAGIGRAFFCTVVGQKVIILHAFIKKTQETPPAQLRRARQRLKEVKHER